MKSAWCMAAAAAALLFSTPLASYGQDPPTPAEPLDTPILLRLAPPEGRVSRYAHSTQAEVENPMMPSNTVMTMRTYQTQTVVRVADGVIRLRTTIDSTSTAMPMPVPGMELPDFSGSAITTEMDTRGRVLGVIDTEGMPAIAGFNPEDLLRQSSSFVLPEGEVSPGDSWTRDVPMELPMGPGGSMSMGIATTYTFVRLEGSLATLSFEGPIDMQLDAGGAGMTATGNMAGTMVVDLAEGRFRSQSTRASFDMNMAGMTMETNVTTTMELIPDP